MTKKLLIVILSIILLITTSVISIATFQSTNEIEIMSTNSEEVQPVRLTIDYVETNNLDELVQLRDECKLMMDTAHQMAENARTLGYIENSVVIKEAQAIWWGYHDCYWNYELKIKDLEKIVFSDEFPEAATIWNYLTNDLGYNNYITAGIMGNVMVECGGFTLDIDHTLYSYGSRYYYGICQWNKSAYPEVRGQDLEYQLKFLADTIKYELDTYGYMYLKGYDYEAFLNMTNERDAALMFAKAYERCGSSTYKLRQNCAEEAYDYFTGLS